MSRFHLISWLLPAFLLLSFNLCAKTPSLDTNALLQQNLYNQTEWHRLLHLNEKQPQITSETFLLSIENFSPKAELLKTIELYQSSPEEALCRYPARYYYLFSKQGENLATNDFEQCEELHKYLQYVPFDELSLVFASEVVDSASSMMGHIFLKASGKNAKSTDVSHSISFFTEINSINPLSLIYDGVVGGMDGFFIVRDFSFDKQRYLNEEGRNLWQYRLKLSEYDKRLIKFHIWELKDVDITYLFQSYNCADLTLELLALASPQVSRNEFIVTPLDVVKTSKQSGIIESQHVLLSPEWENRMFLGGMSKRAISSLQRFVQDKAPLDTSAFQSEEAILKGQKYLQFMHSIGKADQEHLSVFNKFTLSSDSNDHQLDIRNYKNPLKTPDDSMVGIDWVYGHGKHYMDVSFVPASHYLHGDNRQYHSESELLMGEVELRLSPGSGSIDVNKLTLYSMLSLLSDTELDAHWSKQVFMGYKKELYEDGDDVGVFETSFGLGKSYKLHDDILIYALLNVGIGLGPDKFYPTLAPQVGAVLNLVQDSKLIVKHHLTTGRYNDTTWGKHSGLVFSWYGVSDINFSIKTEYREYGNKSELATEAGISFLF